MPDVGSLSPIGGGAIPGVVSPTPILPLSPGASGPNGIPSGFAINKGIPSAIGSNRGFGSDGLIRPGVGGMPQSEVRPMLPGAVIGGTPAIGQGQPGPRTRPPSRVNPIGGVINPNNTEGALGSMGRPSGSAQPLGVVPGRSDRRSGDEKARHWDPDNPWETAEGVSPVLLPAKPPRIDPGPAIGLR
jgi:hypothetical protein